MHSPRRDKTGERTDHPSRESALTKIARPVPDCGGPQVVAIGEGKFGILWNGQLRPEEYPTQQFAFLAIAALRQHEACPDRTGR
jgi:hypothetical protein